MMRIVFPIFLLLVTACDTGAVEESSATTGALRDLSDASTVIDLEPTATVRRTVHDFHRSLATGDSTAVLGLLHPNALILENGHAETVSEYRAEHLAADMRSAAAHPREVVNEEVILLGPDALYLSERQVVGRPTTSAETMFLTRQQDRWLIRHIHWSSR